MVQFFCSIFGHLQKIKFAQLQQFGQNSIFCCQMLINLLNCLQRLWRLAVEAKFRQILSHCLPKFVILSPQLERRTITDVDGGDDRHDFGDDDVDGHESHPNHQLYQDYEDDDLGGEDPWTVTQRPTPFTVRPTLPVGQVENDFLFFSFDLLSFWQFSIEPTTAK